MSAEMMDKKEKKPKKEKNPKEKVPLDKAAKKKRRRIIFACIAGVLIVAFVVMKAMAGPGAQAIVMTAGAWTGEIEETINTSGMVTTLETKTYFSNVDVKIGDIAVQKGDAVKAGDLLLSYDAADLAKEKELAQLSARQAEGSYKNSGQSNNEKLGDLNEANVNLDVLEQQIADVEARIKTLEANIEQKKSDIAYQGTLLQITLLDWQEKQQKEGFSESDEDIYLELQKQVQLNSYEQQNNEEIQKWQEELEVHQDMLSEYKEYQAEMKSQKSSAEAGKLNAGAKEELEANNQTKEIQAADTIESLAAVENGVTAEFDGVVTEINAVEGGSVAQGSPLLKLESTKDVMVQISVTKYDLNKIAVGQGATVSIGSKEYQGEVSKINKMAETNNSGAAVVGTEIRIKDPDSDLILGVEAKVIISTAKEENAVLVPVSAINVDMEGEFVYVVENNILTKKRVMTGISSDLYIQVTEGLSDGEQVVTEVAANLQEGMTVMAMPQQ